MIKKSDETSKPSARNGRAVRFPFPVSTVSIFLVQWIFLQWNDTNERAQKT
jgi:hypothetical protein